MNGELKKIHSSIRVKDYDYFVLGGDIGGTNATFAVAGVKKDVPKLIFTAHYMTVALTSVEESIKEILEYAFKEYGIKIYDACIAGAGLVSEKKDFCSLTNVKWDISAKEILKKTSMKNVLIINDFEALGYAVNISNHKEITLLKPGTPEKNGLKAIIGTGTGLGKAIIIYDKKTNYYFPKPSEGGHSDFAPQDQLEFDLVRSIKRTQNRHTPVEWEDVLSGPGLVNIYSFLKDSLRTGSVYEQEIAGSKSKEVLIALYKDKEPACMETFKMFTKFYARCTKNYVLETLPFGGIYISGGVSLKHKEIFKDKVFSNEFLNSNKMAHVLKKIPVYLLKNPDISLEGACVAAIRNKKKLG